MNQVKMDTDDFHQSLTRGKNIQTKFQLLYTKLETIKREKQ